MENIRNYNERHRTLLMTLNVVTYDRAASHFIDLLFNFDRTNSAKLTIHNFYYFIEKIEFVNS